MNSGPATRSTYPGRRARLLLVVIIVSVALGVVAMHQLPGGHDGHAGTPAVAEMMAVDSSADSASKIAVPRPPGAIEVGGLAAGCLLLLALSVVRPARRGGASYPVWRSCRSVRGSVAVTEGPGGNPRRLSRLQLSVSRT